MHEGPATIAFLPPPGPVVNCRLSSSSSSSSLPSIFADASSVRNSVFIDEQKCTLENEVDADDARSWHWVAYADAVGAPSQSTTGNNKIAAATIRLVPPPHLPHPAPGSVDGVGGTLPMTMTGDGAEEAYVKLGRLATRKEFRGRGLGGVLVARALEWAAAAAGSVRELEAWEGLVLIHAQKDKMGWYGRLGFKLDDGLGEWVEEGIVHVGMWRRVEGVRGAERRGSGS